MAQRESDVIDPFRATGGNTVPPGQYDTDLLTAAPRRGPSAGATSFAPGTAGDWSGAGTAVSGSGVGGARSAPQLSTVGRSSSGKSARTPWYLTTAGIAALVIGLLIALGLGVGLGVGLGTRDSGDSKADAANANGGAASTVTSMSTLNSVITADPSTSYIPVIVTGNSASVATVVQTIGGSTVTLTAAGGGATSRPVITVSQAAPPTTRTEAVYATTYAETQTVTVTGNGGAVSTVTQVVTVQRTITAQAGAFGARRRQRRTIAAPPLPAET